MQQASLVIIVTVFVPYPSNIHYFSLFDVFSNAQATSLAADVKGKTPVLSQILKTASVVKTAAAQVLPRGNSNNNNNNSSNMDLLVKDHDAAIQEIARHHHRTSPATSSVPPPPPPPGKKNAKRQSTRSTGVASDTSSSRSRSSSSFDDNDDDEDVSWKENTTNEDEEFVRAHFSYIITRPTALLKDGPSTKKVAASKSVRFLPATLCCVRRPLSYLLFLKLKPRLHFLHNVMICCSLYPTATWSVSHLACGSGRVFFERIVDQKALQQLPLRCRG